MESQHLLEGCGVSSHHKQTIPKSHKTKSKINKRSQNNTASDNNKADDNIGRIVVITAISIVFSTFFPFISHL
jgi:hypothetical protein